MLIYLITETYMFDYEILFCLITEIYVSCMIYCVLVALSVSKASLSLFQRCRIGIQADPARLGGLVMPCCLLLHIPWVALSFCCS